jgi:thiol-disulfide isomerase/thioredoxin
VTRIPLDRLRTFAPLAFLTLALTGCPDSSNRDDRKTSSPPPAAKGDGPGEDKVGKEPAESVDLRPAKYAQVMNAIRSHKGKVVVMDIWADWCVPCKLEFPGLVKLHEKYSKEGVVCVSLSLDKEDRHAAALAFLKKQRATFSNYRLDEEDEVWQEQFDLNGPPAVLVFDRGGKLARKFDHNDPDVNFDYSDVEKLVKDLLAKGK